MMSMNDPFQINDWSRRRLVVLLLSLQSAYMALLGAEALGLTLPLVRSALGLYLFFVVPGMLLLRLMGAHGLGTIRTMFFSVCLSLATIMVLGLGLNMAFPAMGLSGPLTEATVIVAVNVLLSLLMILVWIFDRRFEAPPLDQRFYISRPAIALYCLPLLAVLSTQVLNVWGLNWLQYIVVLGVAVAFFVVFSATGADARIYPVALGSIALALMLHSALVSTHLVEWADTSFEYWSASRVIIMGQWDPGVVELTNGMLSIVILAPALHFITGTSLAWVFKLIFPLLFTILPLGIYAMARGRLGERPAFLAAFLIVSSAVFYTEMLGLARQMVAELFLVAILLLLMDGRMRACWQACLLCIFAIALGMSHYGLMAIMGICFIASLVIYLPFRRWAPGPSQDLRPMALVTIISVMVMAAWYLTVSASTISDTIFSIFDQLLSGLISPQEVSSAPPSPWTSTGWDLMAWAPFAPFVVMAIAGIGKSIPSRKRPSLFGPAYLSGAMVFIALLFAELYSPGLFAFISRDRLVHICFIVLAPFIALGAFALFERPGARKRRAGVTTIGVFFVILLLIGSGVIGGLIGHPHAFEIDPQHVNRTHFRDADVAAGDFAAVYVGYDHMVFADASLAYLMRMKVGAYNPFVGRTTVDIDYRAGAYYFLGQVELDGHIWLEDKDHPRANTTCVPIDGQALKFFYAINTVYVGGDTRLHYFSDWESLAVTL
jgi:uncharacterized membrane protein